MEVCIQHAFDLWFIFPSSITNWVLPIWRRWLQKRSKTIGSSIQYSFEISVRAATWYFTPALPSLLRGLLNVAHSLPSKHKERALPRLTKTIHFVPKWRPINYSFVCMFISPHCLIFTSKFFCVFYMLTRHQGLISMQTKE